MLSKRIQVLLEEGEYNKLKKMGRRTHRSLGEIFRDAVKLYAERLAHKSQRLALVDKMMKMQAPVAGWREMEKEIIRARS